MKKWLVALTAAVLIGFPIGSLPAHAMVRTELSSDTFLTNMTSVTGNIPATSTVVSFTTASRHIKIQLSSGSAIASVRFDGGVATAANYSIPSGGALDLSGMPGTPSVTIIGASALGTYSILAW